MLKQIVRLVRPGLFLPCFEMEKPVPGAVSVRPRWLSICAADQRYFQGNRPPEVLRKKLPLALFHEALGEVLADPSEHLKRGQLCVLLPGGTHSAGEGSNYAQGAFFRSSNADGFCQERMLLRPEEMIPLPPEADWIYVLTEPLSVAVQALRRLPAGLLERADVRCGVWGDGAMGFLCALAVRMLKPSWQIFAFGKHDAKLANFSFADRVLNAAGGTCGLQVDAAFECVGGAGAQSAIAQAAEALVPMGTLALCGVSETPPAVPTRLVLEKGLLLYGSSRSTRADFECAAELIGDPYVQGQLGKIVSAVEELRSAADLVDAFRNDRGRDYKTVLRCAF